MIFYLVIGLEFPPERGNSRLAYRLVWHGKMRSRLVIIYFDTRRRIVSILSNCNRLCSEEGRAAWNGGLAVFARPSSQRAARGHAETLSHCWSQAERVENVPRVFSDS